MLKVINYIFDEDSLISPFEISFQWFFEGAQKTRDVMQELNNLIFSIVLAVVNCLPRPEYLWSLLCQLVVIIPYVIVAEYKQSMLKKKVYELTWAISYQLRKDMFTVVPPKSKTSFRTSTSSCTEHAETRSVVHMASAPSSLPGRPRRKSLLHMGDTPVDTRLLKIKSSPVMFHGEDKRCPIVNLLEMTPQDLCYDSKFSASYRFEADPQDCGSLKTQDGDKNMENTCIVRPNPAKKFKRDTDDSASRYSTSLVRRLFQKPQVSQHHTFTVQYINVLSRKKAAKCPSGVSQDISTSMGSTSLTKQYVVANESALSWKPSKSRMEASERKWRCIIERNNNMRNERLTKLREIEMQKLQEREKIRKAEMTKRRTVIARIREQNKKILMEQRGMKMNESEGSSDGIVLPVVRVKPIDNKQAAALEEHGPEALEGDMAGKIPVLRVMQRSVTIERRGREYNMMETETLHLRDVETKSVDDEMFREVVKENTGRRIPKIPKNAEYYLESKGTPSNRQLDYVEVRPNSGEIQNGPSFANKSMSEIVPFPLKRFEDTRQVRWNLKKISNESNALFQCTPAFHCGDLKPNSKLSEFDSPGTGVSGSNRSVLMMSRPFDQVTGNFKREKFKSGYKHSSSNTASYSSDHEPTIGDRGVPGGEKVAPSGDGIDTEFQKKTISPSNCDVEALPSPSTSPGSKGRRPAIQRAKRRLQKELNKSDYSQVKNQTHQSGPLDVNNLMSCDSTKIEDFAQQSGLTKSKDAKVGGPKSLLLKKIELRKRLEERRRAITCQNPTINHLTSAGAEKKESHGQHLESRSELTKNSTTRPENKPRRLSLDGNANRTKLRQLRTAPSNCSLIKRATRKGNPTVSMMKKVNSKCSTYRPDRSDDERRIKDRQQRPSPSNPRRSVNHTVFTGSNRRKPCTPAVRPDVRTTTDGTHCRNKVGSPINRKPHGENISTEPGPNGNATDAQCNRQIDTPEGEKETKGQESGNNSTPARDDNFTSISVLADEKRKNVSPEDFKTEIRQDDDSQSEGNTGSGTTDSTKSKRSDFLAFQMDESGHPVPVTQGKDHRRNCSIHRPYSKRDIRRSIEETGKKRKSPTSSKQISKNVGANKGQDTMNDREWNKRMQIWEKKRKQLASGRTSPQVVWKKSLPQVHVIYENPAAIENSYNERMEVRTEAKKSTGENQTSHANSIIRLKECKENKCELRSIQDEQLKHKNGSQKMREGKRKNEGEDGKSLVGRRSTEEGKDAANKPTSAAHIRNQCINKKECSDKEEMVRVHSSLVQPNDSESTNLPFKLENPEERQESQNTESIKRGNSSYESIESERHSEISQRNEFNTPELLGNLEFSKSILSPIQSVSDNNYNSDGVAGTHSYSKMINIKQPSGDSDSIKSTTSYSSQIGNAPREIKLKGESVIKDELPVSSWRSPASHKLQLVEQTRNRKNTGLIKSESATRKIQDTYRIEYPRDSEKNNATENKRPEEERKDCKNTELIPIESGRQNIQDTCRIEYPQDSEEENEAELKIRAPVRRKTTLSELAVDSNTLNCIKEEKEDRKNDRELKVVCELVRKSSSACRKSKEISVILDELLTVTKRLKEEHLSKEFKKNHRTLLEFDRPNDRVALTAIVCYPEGSSIDDIGSLPGTPVFLDSPYTQKRILNPLVVECVASTPAEFHEKSRETNNRFLRNRNDDDQRTATRIEWYEDFYNPPVSSEELDTHQDVHVSYQEKVVDRRGCKSKNLEQGVITAGYSNYKVKRYEIHHDASNCFINSTKRRNNELSQYY